MSAMRTEAGVGRGADAHPVVHLELHTGDLCAARSLYAELLGWRSGTIATQSGSYLTLDVGPELGGGIVECGTERPLWLPYVAVDDVASRTARAQHLGAAVLLAPREGPAGWRSVVRTPYGGEIALWQSKAGMEGLA